jgi:transcription antitermination factor NusG
MNANESKPKRWMVLYTRSKWEKKADKLLKNEGFTSFCPLIKKKSMWSDRTKIVETPLFSSYLFVHVDSKEQSRVQQIPGIVNFVVHCNQPVVIDDLEIQRIHSILKVHTNVETVAINARHIGDRVTINSGPLANHKGEIMQLQGDSVLMIMEKLGCALVVKVDKSKLN